MIEVAEAAKEINWAIAAQQKYTGVIDWGAEAIMNKKSSVDSG